MSTVQFFNLGREGVIQDQPPHTLPPEAWSSAVNMRFDKEGATKILGEDAVFGTPTVAPVFVHPVPSATVTHWLYANQDKIYHYEGGVHTNITRQTASVDVDYTATTDEAWNATTLGGIPILNNGVDVPQFWASYSAGQKMQDLTGWPSTLRAKVVRAFGRYLVAINITDSSVNYPHAIQWSNQSDPGSLPADWDFTDPTSDSGRIELTDSDGGPLRDGLMLGNAMILYKANSTHTLRFVGGNDLFAPDLLLTSSGILATRCACAIKKGTQHFVVTESDVIVHSGQKDAVSVIDDKNRDWLFDNIDPTYFTKAYCFENPFYNEAWFAFPSSGSTEVDTAAIYNYKEGTWSFRQFFGTFAAFGLIAQAAEGSWSSDSNTWDSDSDPWSQEGQRGVLVADKARTELQRLDQGVKIAGTNITSTLERTGLAIVGRDRNGQPKVDYRVIKQVNRIVPKATGTGGFSVQVGVQNLFTDDVTWSDSYSYTIGTTPYIDLDPPVSGKLIAVRFRCTTGSQWRLEGYDLEMALLGNL
jgi:hypothetical protein